MSVILIAGVLFGLAAIGAAHLPSKTASTRSSQSPLAPSSFNQGDAVVAVQFAGSLAFEIVEQRRVMKGGSIEPLLAPKYVLLDAKAVLSEPPAEISEAEAKLTLSALLARIRREAQDLGDPIDGVSAFLYQSQEHLDGGSSALGKAEWWPKGHSFGPDNVASIKNKSTYVESTSVFLLPKKADVVVQRLPKSERRGIFDQLVRSERRASEEALKGFAIDESVLTRTPTRYRQHVIDQTTAQRAEADRLSAVYQRQLLERSAITEEELKTISREASNEQWPMPSN